MTNTLDISLPSRLIDLIGEPSETIELRSRLVLGADLHLVAKMGLEEAAISVGVSRTELSEFVEEKLHREVHAPWIVGNFRAQNEFGAARAAFLSAVSELSQLAQKAVDRIRNGGGIERFLFVQFLMIGEDLNEIQILCANDSTTGAMKTLRGMFERTVVLRYLKQNPRKLDDFFDYHHVRTRKLAREINRQFPGTYSKQELDEFESNYAKVLPHFGPANARREPMSWTRDSIVKLARTVGGLDTLVLSAYYNSMGEVHSTEAAILRRSETSKTGSLEYKDRPGFDEQDTVLMSAHYLMLHATETVIDHFEWNDLQEELGQACRAFASVWQRT